MVSNKTLLVFILIAIAVFIIAFFSTRAVLQGIDPRLQPSTGHALSDTGNVTVNIYESISITTQDDSAINFTNCVAGTPIYSNITGGNDQDSCEGFTPDVILVRNDGSVPVNVTLNISNRGEAHAGTFLDSDTDDSWVAFKAVNDSTIFSYAGGCIGTIQDTWQNITTDDRVVVCDHLQNHATNNSISFDLAFFAPNTTQTGSTALSLVFYASGN